MNREEWFKKRDRLSTVEYKKVHKLLNDWKQKNGISERCIVHHRDDTEETRKYNAEHYELWGYNEDGTFEYGKYVVFMTCADHMSYHRTGKTVSDETRAKMSAAHQGKKGPNYGKKGPNYGKKFSDEHRAKMSAAHQGKKGPNYGKKFSDEHRAKMSAAHQGAKVLYTAYKNNGGILQWKVFRKALKNGEITFEMQPITVYTK